MSSESKICENESYLFAFDFDHTVVNENSDYAVVSLAKCPVPPDIKKFYDGTNFTEYMNKIFQFLHEQGVSIKDICEFVKMLEGTKGIVPLLRSLVHLKAVSSNPCIHLLIISDANDLFISEFLRAQVLDAGISNLNDTSAAQQQQLPFDIITNSAQTSFCSIIAGPLNNNSSSMPPLQISPYEFQTSCKICPKNLCKGSAIQKYIQEKGPFSKVFYTGDGANDVCPALKLNQSDYVFVRKNYSMHKRLLKSENNLGINANLVLWDDGIEVRTVMEKFLKGLSTN